MSREGRTLDLTPDCIVYRANRISNSCMLLVWLFAISGGVVLRDVDRTVASTAIVVFAALATAKIVDLLPGSMRLTLNRDGFALRRFYFSQMVRWDEVAEPFKCHVGPLWAIGYLCSHPYRKHMLSRWYHRALSGIDGWIVPWKFRPQTLSIPGAMHLFWQRARANSKLQHWQPDILLFEGNNVYAWVLLLFCGWITYYVVGMVLSGKAISPLAWIIIIGTGFFAFTVLVALVPGAIRLTLMQNGFELRVLWHRRLVRWIDIERPFAVNWPWRGIVCQFRPGVKRKFSWLDYYNKDVGTYSGPNAGQNVHIVKVGHAPHAPLLKFMADFWERANAATLDPASSKD